MIGTVFPVFLFNELSYLIKKKKRKKIKRYMPQSGNLRCKYKGQKIKRAATLKARLINKYMLLKTNSVGIIHFGLFGNFL